MFNKEHSSAQLQISGESDTSNASKGPTDQGHEQHAQVNLWPLLHLEGIPEGNKDASCS